MYLCHILQNGALKLYTTGYISQTQRGVFPMTEAFCSYRMSLKISKLITIFIILLWFKTFQQFNFVSGGAKDENK